MKAIATTQELALLLSKCMSVVPQKPANPLLANILLEAKENSLILTATDLALSIRCQVEAKVLEQGSTALPAKRLAALIRELNSPNVEICSNEHNMTTITCSNSSFFKLRGTNSEEFPVFSDLTDTNAIKADPSALKTLLQQTAFSAAREDERKELTGLLLVAQSGKLSAVGTDGKRLAKAEIDIEADPSLKLEAIVPIKAVEEIMRNLIDDEPATLSFTEEKIGLKTDHCTLTSKLVVGQFPNFQQIIPDTTDVIVSLHKEELSSLLRQLSLFTSEEIPSVKFSFSDGEVKLAINSADIGEGRVSMPVNYRGQQLDIAFNPRYFLDILRHGEGETINLGLTDSFNPGIFTGDDSSSPLSYLFILMPLRLQ